MPTYFQDSDITLMLNDIGVPVVIGTTNLKGLVNYVGRDVLQQLNIIGISATTITVTVQTSALPSSLPNRTALVVEGQNMRLRDSVQEDDGALTHLLCERS